MTSPTIRKITYREYADDLFDGQDTTGIDVSASAAQFLDRLEQALCRSYPAVCIVVEETAQPISHNRRILVETEPVNDEDGAALYLSDETAFDVQQIASDVYERGDWYVETES